MDAPTITIQATLSREGLLELRAAIDALLTADASDALTWDANALQANADRKVGEVWSRVGENLKRFLATAAQNVDAGQEFSMNDAADWLGKDPKTVRSWYRNLGRTLKHVDAAIPEPPLLEARWDGHRNLYSYPIAVRTAILNRDMDPASTSALQAWTTNDR